MAISIREILASDTISQFADKVNYNFDQIILNGGGPAGPKGDIGPRGPVGGRGIRGSKWFEGVGNPNSLTIPDSIDQDYFLSSDGTVWEFDGTDWIDTGIDLTGPAGPTGSTEWDRFGSAVPYIGGDNGISIKPDAGSANSNQIRTLLIGGTASTDATYGNWRISYQNEATANISAGFIHVPDDTIKSMVFSGGNSSLNYTVNTNEMAHIKLLTDDHLNITIPKTASNTSGKIGFSIVTKQKGLYYESGRDIIIRSGTLTDNNGVSASGDILIESTNSFGKLADDPLITTFANGSKKARIRLGNTGSGVPVQATGSSSWTGNIATESYYSYHWVNKAYRLISSDSIFQQSSGTTQLRAAGEFELGRGNVSGGNTIRILLDDEIYINQTANENPTAYSIIPPNPNSQKNWTSRFLLWNPIGSPQGRITNYSINELLNSNAWILGGNAISSGVGDPDDIKLGTTDANDVSFISNGVQVGRIDEDLKTWVFGTNSNGDINSSITINYTLPTQGKNRIVFKGYDNADTGTGNTYQTTDGGAEIVGPQPNTAIQEGTRALRIRAGYNNTGTLTSPIYMYSKGPVSGTQSKIGIWSGNAVTLGWDHDNGNKSGKIGILTDTIATENTAQVGKTGTSEKFRVYGQYNGDHHSDIQITNSSSFQNIFASGELANPINSGTVNAQYLLWSRVGRTVTCTLFVEWIGTGYWNTGSIPGGLGSTHHAEVKLPVYGGTGVNNYLINGTVNWDNGNNGIILGSDSSSLTSTASVTTAKIYISFAPTTGVMTGTFSYQI